MVPLEKKNLIYTALLFLLLLLPATHQLSPISIPVGSFYITAKEIIMFAIFALWLVQLPMLIKYGLNKKIFAKFIYIFILFIIIHLVIGIFRYGPVLALGDFRQYIPVFLYFPIVHIYRSEKAIVQMRRAMFWVLIIVAVYTLFVFIFFNDVMISLAQKQGTKVAGERIIVFNSLTALYAYLGFIISVLFLRGKMFPGKFLGFSIIVLNAAMVLIMQSRTHWVLFLLIMFLTFFSFRSHLTRFFYFFVSAYSICLILSVGYLGVYILNYKPTIVGRVEASLTDRIVSFVDIVQIGTKTKKKSESIGTLETRWETNKLVMKDYIIPNIIFGMSFGSKIPAVNRFGEIYKWKYNIDSGYLTILAKFGLIGFIFYFLFIAKMIFILFKILNFSKIKDEDKILVKSFIYMVIALLIGSFSTSIFVRQQTAMVSLLIVIAEIEYLYLHYR